MKTQRSITMRTQLAITIQIKKDIADNLDEKIRFLQNSIQHEENEKKEGNNSLNKINR